MLLKLFVVFRDNFHKGYLSRNNISNLKEIWRSNKDGRWLLIQICDKQAKEISSILDSVIFGNNSYFKYILFSENLNK